MKQTNKIDNLFEGSLSGMKVAPPSASWGNISSSIAASGAATPVSRRKKIITWFGISASVAALIIGLFYIRSCNQDAVFNTTELAQTNEHTHSSNIESKESKTPDQTIVDDLQEKPSPTEQTQTVSTQDSESIENTQIVNAQKSSTTHLKEKIQQIKVRNIPKQSWNNNSKTESKKEIEKAKQENLSSHIANSEEKLVPSQTKQEASTEEKVNEYLSVDTYNSNDITTAIEEHEQQEAIDTTTYALTPMYPFKAKELDAHISDSLNVSNVPNFTTGFRYATGFSVHLYGGPSYIINQSSQARPYIENGYTKDIDKNTSDYNFGLGLRYHLNSFFVHSGVQLSSFGEKTKYSWNRRHIQHLGFDSVANISVDYTYSPIDFYVLPSGDSVTVFESIADTNYVYSKQSIDSAYNAEYQQKATNQYRFIEIPVMVGYQMEFKRVSIDFSAGLGFAIPYGASGYVLANGALQPIQDNTKAYQHAFVNLLVGAGVHYRISNSLSFNAMPMYRTNLTHFYPVEDKKAFDYHTFHINLGMSYTF